MLSAVPPEDAAFESLTVMERGFVLGSTMLGIGAEGAAVLARGAAERCASALQTLAKLPRERKAVRLAQLAPDVAAPFPAGLELCHRAWIRRMMAAEPSDLLPALVAGAPPAARAAAAEILAERAEAEGVEPVTLPPELATELRRLVFASAADARPAGAGAEVAPLLELDAAGLREELRRMGARSLGYTLHDAPLEVKARAMAAVGKFSQDLRAASESADARARHEAEADVKAVSIGPGGTVEERLEGMGFSALCRQLRGESPEVRRAVALRLPLRLAQRLLPEAAEAQGEPR
jgi:hypothetical protein